MSEPFDFTELYHRRRRAVSGSRWPVVLLIILAGSSLVIGGVILYALREKDGRPPSRVSSGKKPSSTANAGKPPSLPPAWPADDPEVRVRQRQADEAFDRSQREALLAEEEKKRHERQAEEQQRRRDRQAEAEIDLLQVGPGQKARAREMRRLLRQGKLDLNALPGHDQLLFFENFHVFAGPEARKAILAAADRREDCCRYIDNLGLKGTPYEADVKVAFMRLPFADHFMAVGIANHIKKYGRAATSIGEMGQFIRQHRDLFPVP